MEPFFALGVGVLDAADRSASRDTVGIVVIDVRINRKSSSLLRRLASRRSTSEEYREVVAVDICVSTLLLVSPLLRRASRRSTSACRDEEEGFSGVALLVRLEDDAASKSSRLTLI